MTTIVYANNEMAWDSRTTAGPAIIRDDSQKKHVRGGVTFWMAGTVGDYDEFFEGWDRKQTRRELNVAAFALEDGVLYRCGSDDDGSIWTSRVLSPEAIGSGSEHAITAIDCGLSAAQAVKMAAKRDTRTGGKIRSQKLKLR
jgi:hypothetical protein